MLFFDLFSDLTEVRADDHRYPLPHLVFIAVYMILCGANDWKMVSALGKKKTKWLKRYIPLLHGAPRHTFDRVLARLNLACWPKGLYSVILKPGWFRASMAGLGKMQDRSLSSQYTGCLTAF